MARKLTDRTLVEVFNNSTGSVSFYSQFGNITRRWDIPDSKRDIPLGELKDLINSAGGYQLLVDDLRIVDIDIREELGLPVEKVHVLSKEEIVDLLKNKSSDELAEVLNTTNEGIKDRIVATSVELSITDTDKMDVIKEHTDIDVYALIKEKKEDQKEKTKKTK